MDVMNIGENPNPDPRILPPGWSQHYDAQRGVWFYMQTNVIPSRVSYVHPSGTQVAPTPALTHAIERKGLSREDRAAWSVSHASQGNVTPSQTLSNPHKPGLSSAQQLYAKYAKKTAPAAASAPPPASAPASTPAFTSQPRRHTSASVVAPSLAQIPAHVAAPPHAGHVVNSRQVHAHGHVPIPPVAQIPAHIPTSPNAHAPVNVVPPPQVPVPPLVPVSKQAPAPPYDAALTQAAETDKGKMPLSPIASQIPSPPRQSSPTSFTMDTISETAVSGKSSISHNSQEISSSSANSSIRGSSRRPRGARQPSYFSASPTHNLPPPNGLPSPAATPEATPTIPQPPSEIDGLPVFPEHAHMQSMSTPQTPILLTQSPATFQETMADEQSISMPKSPTSAMSSPAVLSGSLPIERSVSFPHSPNSPLTSSIIPSESSPSNRDSVSQFPPWMHRSATVPSEDQPRTELRSGFDAQPAPHLPASMRRREAHRSITEPMPFHSPPFTNSILPQMTGLSQAYSFASTPFDPYSTLPPSTYTPADNQRTMPPPSSYASYPQSPPAPAPQATGNIRAQQAQEIKQTNKSAMDLAGATIGAVAGGVLGVMTGSGAVKGATAGKKLLGNMGKVFGNGPIGNTTSSSTVSAPPHSGVNQAQPQPQGNRALNVEDLLAQANALQVDQQTLMSQIPNMSGQFSPQIPNIPGQFNPQIPNMSGQFNPQVPLLPANQFPPHLPSIDYGNQNYGQTQFAPATLPQHHPASGQSHVSQAQKVEKAAQYIKTAATVGSAALKVLSLVDKVEKMEGNGQQNGGFFN